MPESRTRTAVSTSWWGSSQRTIGLRTNPSSEGEDGRGRHGGDASAEPAGVSAILDILAAGRARRAPGECAGGRGGQPPLPSPKIPHWLPVEHVTLSVNSRRPAGPTPPAQGEVMTEAHNHADRPSRVRRKAIPATCGQLPGPPPPWSSRTVTGSDGQAMTCLSMNEIRRMHAALCRPAHPPGHYLHWSAWRRRHQATARRCHYQRRLKRGY